MAPSTEEGKDLQEFNPVKARLLLREVYGDFPHNNDGTHLSGGVPDDAMQQIRWRRIAAQLDSWYSTPLGEVGRRFTAVLDVEW